MNGPDESNRGGSPLIELQTVSMEFAGRDGTRVDLFEGLAVAVRRGELVVISGRSGSGKTTALNVAAGLIEPTSGDVRWLCDSIRGAASDALAERRAHFVGIVFQNAALIDTLTAAENVALAAIGAKVSRSPTRVNELLARVGLSARAAHFPAQLSGGEQQRVAVARALYADPPVMIVDEPTANLDRRTADGVIQLLEDLRAAEHGLLVASHDPGVIAAATVVVELEAFVPHATKPSQAIGDWSEPRHLYPAPKPRTTRVALRRRRS
jgi:ABC-type lipoprotein export system ATPase subunit